MSTLPKKVVMLGVCGMGMAPLAVYLRQAGCEVLGWDDQPQVPVLEVLRAAGVTMCSGACCLEEVDLVVRSSAVSQDDARVRQAQTLGIEVLRRGELLARLSRDCRLVAVVGSHGKTTTTGMLVHALELAGFSFSYLVGGLFAKEKRWPGRFVAQANDGGKPWMVAEVDESDGTVEAFCPEVTLALNFDWDHADHYRSEGDLEQMFVRLFGRTAGAVFVPQADARLSRLAAGAGCQVFHWGEGGEYAMMPVAGSAGLFRLSGCFSEGMMSVDVVGDFNQRNALAALAVAHHLVGRLPDAPLEAFRGMGRRQDELYRDEHLAVLADYAHHPTEIRALLDFARARYGGPVSVVFQPHRFTRTKQFARQFAESLCAAERVWLLPVYAASELPLPDGTSAVIAAACRQLGREVVMVEGQEELETALHSSLDGARCLLFVGAGDIDAMAAAFVAGMDKKTRRTLPDFLAGAALSADLFWRENYPLSRKTTIRVGGCARYYAEPAGVADLQALLVAASSAGVPVFVLGRGSNLLVHEEGFPGLVVHLAGETWKGVACEGEGRLRVGAGVRLQALSAKACKLGLAGFEFLEGIPGSVGGALRMNAGAMNGWMFDLVEELVSVDMQGNLKRRLREACAYAYRHCESLEHEVAVEVLLRAPAGEESAVIRERMRLYAQKRVESQPREPSAGCVFKNPEGDHAGRIIDGLGLKGLRVGGAEVSAVHANFIVNKGGATSRDVVDLVRQVREIVRARTGVVLEPEVMLVGKRWEEVL